MVRQARILAQATSDLVNAIKMDAEGESDLENSRKLLSAAKLLADATAKMVEAAKVRHVLYLMNTMLCFRLFLFAESGARFCRERPQTRTARSNSRGCVRPLKASAWPPTLPPRMPSRNGSSTSWR